MTIAIGILCKDGAVLAADSQETVQGYWKRREGKIMAHTVGPSQNLSIAMAGAGRAGYVDALIDCLAEGSILELGHWHKTIGRLRSNLIQFHRDHVVPYQQDPPEAPLVIAMQKGRYLPSLFVTDRSTLTAVGRVAAVGIGAGHALSILNRVATRHLSFNSIVALAAYVIHHTKQHVADCGDVTSIVGIRRGQTIYIPPEASAAMDEEFSRFVEQTEPSIVQMLVGGRKVKGFSLSTRIALSQKIISTLARKRFVSSGKEVYYGSLPREDE